MILKNFTFYQKVLDLSYQIYVVNPLFSIYVGYAADRLIYPVVNSLLFLLGTWIFFDMGEIAFVYYAIVYLMLGLIMMFVKHKCKI